MIRDGTSRPSFRLVVTLLAAWMAAFSVIAAVHNHGPLGAISKTAVLTQPGAGTVQAGACAACLASHVPLYAPGAPLVLSAPLAAAPHASAGTILPVSLEFFSTRSSRAPPSSSLL
jgi:hypothetical protein